MIEQFENTDKEIWRETSDYYSPSIFTTGQNGIGINIGGTVYLKPVEDWHRLADKLEDIRDVHHQQGQPGTWDSNQYMIGLYNGLELALSILEGRQPEFRGKEYRITTHEEQQEWLKTVRKTEY